MDLGRYLARIGYRGSLRPTVETLRALHRAHLATVPYENLDIQLGDPPPLVPEAVCDKIVRRRRGGYCYELNLAFAQLITAIGLDVAYTMAAVGRRDEPEPAWGNHLALVVRLDGQRWLADVGVGDGFLEPLPLRAGIHRQGPFRYVLEPGDHWWVGHHQWGAIEGYWLSDDPRDYTDFVPYHLHQATSPESPFVRTLLVQQPRREHTITLRAATLTIAGPAGKRTVHLASHDEFVAVLREEFGLPVADLDTRRLFALASAQTRAWLAARRAGSTIPANPGHRDGWPVPSTVGCGRSPHSGQRSVGPRL